MNFTSNVPARSAGTKSAETLRALASLISKCEKAQQRLAPEKWQHTKLEKNVKSLRVGYALIKADSDAQFTRDELDEALRALASLAATTEKVQAKFALGTSQHSLLRNRLAALKQAKAAISAEL